jgi:hypothetical protein
MRIDFVQKILLIVIVGALVAALSYFMSESGSTSDMCEFHFDLFKTELNSATVSNKFVDKRNHSIETVLISYGKEEYVLLLIPDSNNKDFEYLKIGDVISKPAHSLTFMVNGGYEFHVDFDCEYVDAI